MFTLYVIQTVGRLVAILPSFATRFFCLVLGELLFALHRPRRRIILSNLRHAFPHKSTSWHLRIGRLTCRRTVEMGLFILASPFFSRRRAKRCLILPVETERIIAGLHTVRRGGMALVPHFNLMETLAFIPLLSTSFPILGNIYRPLDNKPLDAWVKRSRERFGVKLLSRREGYQKVISMIRAGGWVSIPFDQNAGDVGALITSFGRVASCTELPQILYRRLQVPAVVAFPKRISFWKAELHIDLFAEATEQVNLTLRVNRWLENYLRSHEDQIANWLWIHNRWKTQFVPKRRLRLQNRRNLLDEDRIERRLKELPRRTKFWIRTPNWLGDLVMMLPLLRAMRKGRPDVALVIVTKAAFIPLLDTIKLGDAYIGLPEKGNPLAYLKSFTRHRQGYPDTAFLFTNSWRGDLEAWLLGASQRFGVQRPGRPRPFLSHSWTLSGDVNEEETHQMRVWELFLRRFGLTEAIDTTPFKNLAECAPESPRRKAALTIGLICGTGNQPEKRWPVTHWRRLVESLITRYKDVQLMLFGSLSDRAVTDAVARDFPPERVSNLAGQTDLLDFARSLCRCAMAIGNDTGGIHLANAFGLPIVAIFGPTNPIRTGPVFQAPFKIVQPIDCPSTGDMPIERVSETNVLEAVDELL